LPTPSAEGGVDADEDIIGRITVPVAVNGRGPFPFIVDTGANRTALSRELAARLELPIAGEGPVHAFTGVFTAPLVAVGEIRSGALSLSNLNLPIVERRVLAGADGLLGVDGMIGRRLVFDFLESQIRIEAPSRRIVGANWYDVPAERRFGNLIVSEGRIGRIPVRVIVDTGANQSFANTPLRDALQGRGARAQPVTGTRIASVGANPIVLDEAVVIPRINFGRAEVRNVVAYVGDLYIFQIWNLADTPTVVIGMDLLSQLDAVAIDYERELIQFRSRRRAPPPSGALIARPDR